MQFEAKAVNGKSCITKAVKKVILTATEPGEEEYLAEFFDAIVKGRVRIIPKNPVEQAE
jgi:hypothetical protein